MVGSEQFDISQKDNSEESAMNTLVLIILAILLPPVAVFLKSGVGKDLIINILLCFIFYLPGILHALWVVAR